MTRQQRKLSPSCGLCRARKLRCNRANPCSNCKIRGVQCDSVTGKRRPAAISETPVDAELSATKLLERIAHLEAVIADRDSKPEQSPENLSRNDLAPSLFMSSRLKNVTSDVLTLEKSCSTQDTLGLSGEGPLVVCTRPILEITESVSFNHNYGGFAGVDAASFAEPKTIRCVNVPLRHEAHILVNKFIADVSPFHHVIHTTSLHRVIDSLFNDLDQGRVSDTGTLLLLLAICSSSSYMWTILDNHRRLYPDIATADSQSMMWLRASLDVIDYTHRTSRLTIECTQAMVIVFFQLCCREGISRRARSLAAQAIVMARALELHRIDFHNQSSDTEGLQCSRTQTEIGRRVWWYITATDWFLSRLSVSQQDIYPSMSGPTSVKKPRHLDDADVGDGKHDDRPLDEATNMSYLLQRIRLAEIIYDLPDWEENVAPNPETASYNRVMKEDARLRQFMRDLPPFFDLNRDAHAKTAATGSWYSPRIITQKYLLNMVLHARFCKLHMPFLARGTVEPAFAYSRHVCLESARMIIKMEHQLSTENLPFALFRRKMNVKLRSIFVACNVFVLDACLAHGNEVGGQVDDLADVWKILREARDQSPSASKLLDISVQIVRRHNPGHPVLEAEISKHDQANQVPSEASPVVKQHHNYNDRSLIEHVNHASAGSFLGQNLDTFQGEVGGGGADWAGLYTLEAPFL
ncbi:fungal transcriptional regulatory [Fusarium mundagurra]|uniref:Fungal transcriptional regulatory n=1 Tax=Fusarium mundagurra TaxID=1567541 RepID=A0A8H6D102_9HYPO|nr:fungal transcriptional regulatory [Fusarium mundagurra]